MKSLEISCQEPALASEDLGLSVPEESMRLLRRAVRVGQRAGLASASQTPLDDLRELLGADRLAFVRGRKGDSGALKVSQLTGSNWLSEGDLRAWAQGLEAGSDPMWGAIAKQGTVVTKFRRGAIKDSEWAVHPVVTAGREKFNICDCVYSALWAGESFMLLAAFRAPGHELPFGQLEATLLDVAAHVMQPGPDLGRRSHFEEAEAALTPRVRAVLRKLVEGYTEKEIARQLGMASSTVHSHVVAIYRRLNVASRAELMSLLFNGTRPVRPELEGAK